MCITGEDGRLSIVHLAKALGVTEVTARRKLRRLLGDGIIQVVATVDPFDVGYETPVIIGLKVQRSKLDTVARRLSELPQVRYVGASNGRVDLIVEVVVRTNQDLADFLMDNLGSTPRRLTTRCYQPLDRLEWEVGPAEMGRTECRQAVGRVPDRAPAHADDRHPLPHFEVGVHERLTGIRVADFNEVRARDPLPAIEPTQVVLVLEPDAEDLPGEWAFSLDVLGALHVPRVPPVPGGDRAPEQHPSVQ